MAKVKRLSEEKYIEDELAQSQADPTYTEGDNMPAEQYNSPESMSRRSIDYRKNKSAS